MAEARPGYTVRASLLAAPVVWSIADAALIRSRKGAADKVWSLADLRRVVLSHGGSAYVRDRGVLRLVFRRGQLQIGSLSAGGGGHIDDQSAAFSAFTRELCAAASRHQHVRFETGAGGLDGLFGFVFALLAIGVLAITASSVAMGATALGVEMATRLVFVLCLMWAVRPWIAARQRRFDPMAIASNLLP